jgi:hypothetical protein
MIPPAFGERLAELAERHRLRFHQGPAGRGQGPGVHTRQLLAVGVAHAAFDHRLH